MASNMISAPERKVFYCHALRRGNLRDIGKFLYRYFSPWFHQWRWKHGIYFRRKSTRSSTTEEARSDFLSTRKWRGDFQSVQQSVRDKYRVIIPPVAPYAGTFRAAGGKRLPWPTGKVLFDDPEDAHSWHRLYWALEWQGKETADQLADWFGRKPDDISTHPYTTSERIRVILELLGTFPIPEYLAEKLVDQVYRDATRLHRNMEFHLGVHNHLLNNARALCAAGHFFNKEPEAGAWLDSARSIWDKYWLELILDDGFFAEQSTVYHVLLTRTLLEYFWDIRLSGRDLPQGMTEKALSMCRITNILVRPDGSIPVFGDVTPDMPLAWLRGLPVVCYAADLLKDEIRDNTDGYGGGASAFFKRHNRLSAARRKKTDPDQLWESELFPSGGFLFARHKSGDIELTAHGDLRTDIYGHGDSGRGSFEIWWAGRRIVVDGGVPTYSLDGTGIYFRGPAGQNVITIDGIAPSLVHYESDRFPEWYTSLNGPGEWDHGESYASYTWMGFGRYRLGLRWVRTWRWGDTSIKITDHLEGWNGTVDVRGYLHFGEDGWHAAASRYFRNTQCALRITSRQEVRVELITMPHAPEYGVVCDRAQGITVFSKAKLPFEMEWTFEFELEDHEGRCAGSPEYLTA